MQPEKLFAALQEGQSDALRKQAATAIEAQIKVVGATFEKSAAYTNLIILSAYAGFFGLWQLTKDYLTKEFALWSALLMLVSVVTFVFFEVVKMVLIQHNFLAQVKLLKSPEVQRSRQALEKAFNDLGVVYERSLVHFMRFWFVSLLVTIFSGMSAASILGFAFVLGITR